MMFWSLFLVGAEPRTSQGTQSKPPAFGKEVVSVIVIGIGIDECDNMFYSAGDGAGEKWEKEWRQVHLSW